MLSQDLGPVRMNMRTPHSSGSPARRGLEHGLQLSQRCGLRAHAPQLEVGAADMDPPCYSLMACSSARNAASVRMKPHRLHSSGSPPGRGATVPKQSGLGHVYLGAPDRTDTG